MDTDMYACDLTIVAADASLFLRTGNPKFRPYREPLTFQRLKASPQAEPDEREILRASGVAFLSPNEDARSSDIPHEVIVLAALCTGLENFQIGRLLGGVYTVRFDSAVAAIRAPLLIHWLYEQFGEDYTHLKLGF